MAYKLTSDSACNTEKYSYLCHVHIDGLTTREPGDCESSCKVCCADAANLHLFPSSSTSLLLRQLDSVHYSWKRPSSAHLIIKIFLFLLCWWILRIENVVCNPPRAASFPSSFLLIKPVAWEKERITSGGCYDSVSGALRGFYQIDLRIDRVFPCPPDGGDYFSSVRSAGTC